MGGPYGDELAEGGVVGVVVGHLGEKGASEEGAWVSRARTLRERRPKGYVERLEWEPICTPDNFMM